MLPNSETANIKSNLDPMSSQKLEDPRIKDAANQTLTDSVVEDSKQAKDEFGKQISSQLGPEESKQVQSEGQLSISPSKKSVMTGKLIYKDQHSHC